MPHEVEIGTKVKPAKLLVFTAKIISSPAVSKYYSEARTDTLLAVAVAWTHGRFAYDILALIFTRQNNKLS